jgi:DUF1680 family protein
MMMNDEVNHPAARVDALNTASFLTRREALKVLGAGTLLAAAGPLASGCANATPTTVAPPSRKQFAVTPKAEAFPLADVRLLDGPFLEAQKRNEAYLLKLEPDRMLHNFRVNAGLEPRAPVYGGWESAPTWVGLRTQGHTLGHYLTAASLMFAATGHDEMKRRVDYIVAELKECQDAGKTGLICAFPDQATQIDNMVAGRRVTGVPWYTLHKVFAGLRDAHLSCGSAVAREVLVRFADWAVDVAQGMTDEQFQRMLGVEHGGMNEVLADVYLLTKDQRHLALAERFCHQAVIEPLSEGRDTLNGLHSNTQIPKFIGFEWLHQVTGKPLYHAAAEFFWKTVTRTRSFATGGNGDNEHFFPITEFARHLSSAKTMETWKEKGIMLRQITSFPETGKTRLEIQTASPRRIALHIRHPGWASTASVRINGANAKISRTPGCFIELSRRWKAGDVVEVDLPMALRMELLPGTTDTAAVVYGPIVLVGALGHEVKPGDDLHINERTIGSVFNSPIEVPAFTGELAGIPKKIKPAGAPLAFTTDGVGRPSDVTLMPYYKLTHQRYSMYWKVQNS